MQNLPDEKRARVRGAVQEIANSMDRQKAERDFINDTLKRLVEEEVIDKEDKKIVRRMAKVRFKNNFPEEANENELFETGYKEIMNG